jgi:hypothetical protein
MTSPPNDHRPNIVTALSPGAEYLCAQIRAIDARAAEAAGAGASDDEYDGDAAAWDPSKL